MLRAAVLVASIVAIDVVPDSPARLHHGSTPTDLPRLAGQCTLLFGLDVDTEGAVSDVAVFRKEPLLTTVFAHAMRGWRFEPATREGIPVMSRVLVAMVLRPPLLTNVGPCDVPPPGAGAIPQAMPAPTALAIPAYPPQALGDEIAVVEVEVDEAGGVVEARPVGRPSAFSAAATEAARGWSFRPALADGAPVDSVAYLVFGFQEPVLAPPLGR